MTEDYSKYQKYVDYIDSYRNASNAATGSTVDSNANVENKNVTTLSSEIFKPDEIGVCRKMMTDKLAEMYGQDIAEQYLKDLQHHTIYKHDETHSQLPYCASITLYPFLNDGLAKLGGISGPPKNLEAFCGSFINLVFAVSAQLAGACLYRDQMLKIKREDDVRYYTINSLINLFPLTHKLTNYQGEWEYADISDKGYEVLEEGKYVPIKKVMRRKYSGNIYNISTAEGCNARTSKDHIFKVVVDGETKEAKAETLKVGDEVYCSVGDRSFPDKIRKILVYQNDDPYVYEIETESHWYNCGGMITHNCATPEFLTYLDYFIRKKYGDDYTEHVEDLVDISKKGRTLDKVITDCFEQVVYSLNQPAAARGYQSVFWNIAYFDHPYFEEIFRDFVFPDGDEPKWETVSWLQKRFMKWFNAERLRKPLTFPVETVNLLDNGTDYVDQEWADFAAEMYAEGHSFFTYRSDSVDSLASCCYTDDTEVIVKIDDKIYIKSFNELKHYHAAEDRFVIYSNGEWRNGKLVELPNRQVYKVELANGMKMKLTDNHRNNCYGGMRLTSELTVGDFIMAASKKDSAFIPDDPVVEKIIRGEKVVIPNKKEASKVIADCVRAGVVVKKDVRAMGSVVLQRYTQSCLTEEDLPDDFIWDDADNLYFRITGIKKVDYTGNVFCFEMDDKNDDKFTLANGIHNYNCRLRNGLQNNVFSYTLGAGGISTGSKCVITLNINRIVQDATRDGKDLSEAIREVVKRVHKYLAAYNEMIKDNLNSGLLPLYDAGFIDMKRQYLTVGFNGLVEAAEFLGIDVAVNDDYREFTNKILKPIYELNQEDRTEELMFNTEYVPSLIRGDCVA